MAQMTVGERVARWRMMRVEETIARRRQTPEVALLAGRRATEERWLREHAIVVDVPAAPGGKPGRPRKYSSAAERQAAYAARKGQAVTFYLDAETAAALRQYMARRVDSREGNTLTQSDVLARLVRTQLLRKR